MAEYQQNYYGCGSHGRGSYATHGRGSYATHGRGSYATHGRGSYATHERGSHPSHLRGRDIGLFYAKLSQEKKKHMENRNRLIVQIDPLFERHLIELLRKIKNSKFESSSKQFKNHFSLSEYHQTCTAQKYVHRSLFPQPSLDEQLHSEFCKRMEEPDFRLEKRKTLPSYKMKKSILEAVENNQVVVITGETGCGKTTQVPQYILDSFIKSKKGSLCKIVCTQPRRISAISVAERVAYERNILCGNDGDVGYQIRLEQKLPRNVGSILFCTTGIMLQKLQDDRYFYGISHMIIDEVHEQDVQTDFLLTNFQHILKERKDLKVILMSATVNAKDFSKYFGGCPILEIPGFTYPVEDIYLEDILEMTKYRPSENSRKRRPQGPKWLKYRNKSLWIEEENKKMSYLNKISQNYSPTTMETLHHWDEENIDVEFIVQILRYIHCHQKEGAILVFLPGWKEIRDVHKLLTNDLFFSSNRFLIIPLHSMMPSLSQCTVFNKPPAGIRKIILSTNIAETSITIDDVVFVIDSGKMKFKSLDHKTNIQTLAMEWVFLANITQRRGRAGRTQDGICYHMFTKDRKSKLLGFPEPELVRTRLEEVILRIKVLKIGAVLAFLEKAMIPPNMGTINHAIVTLKRLNALDCDENLTALGYHLARLPMDPQIGKMILMATIFCCLDPILSVAASLSHKDAFVVPLGKEQDVDQVKERMANKTQSDHLMFANVIAAYEKAKQRHRGREFCYDHFLCESTLKMLQDLKTLYCQYLVDLGFLEHNDSKHPDYNINSKNELLVKAIICSGLYPNVARLMGKTSNRHRKSGLKAITEEGTKVTLHPRSINAYEENMSSTWLVYHLRQKSSEVFLHDTTPTTAFSLIFFGGKLETNDNAIVVDDWIDFQCSESTANLVLSLRRELDKLFEHKIACPGVTNWCDTSKEGMLMKCITELITIEESRRVGDTMEQ